MKDLIILGSGPSNVRCPYDTEVWSVFAMIFRAMDAEGREARPAAKRVDMVLITDEQACAGAYAGDPGVVGRKQKQFGFELMTASRWDGLVSTLYPVEEVLADFGTMYFEDSVCYMIALAIHRGYEKIRLYGVDCRWYTYAVTERNCTEFWCGVARGRGLEVELPPDTSLFKLGEEDSMMKVPAMAAYSAFKDLLKKE